MRSLRARCTLLGLAILTGAGVADALAADSSRVSNHARIWHAHHSGWLIETPRHLLIFDFIGDGGQDSVRRLVDRLLQASESDGRRVLVFVTHEHDDHYSSVIYKWQRRIPSITYVLGLHTRKAENRVMLEARADTVVDGVRVRTIRSTDLGVGFFVDVDSMGVFHAGDHAQWDASERAAYEREIDWLVASGVTVDLAFVPIATGWTCESSQDLEVGAAYALIKLRPAVAFPMHVRCPDRLHLYRAFAEHMKSYAGRGTLLYAERLGEGFDYDPRTRQVVRLRAGAE